MKRLFDKALVMILLVAMVFAFSAAPSFADGDDPTPVSAIDYDGDTMMFVQADLTSTFGMLSPAEGTTPSVRISADGTKVKITYTPTNTSVYAGFYIEADRTMPSTWLEDKFIATKSDGTYDFELDVSYCGKAWPVAPVKKSDMTATTSKQYYLAIPAADKLDREEGALGEIVSRIFGENRVETSLKVADEILKLRESGKFDKVILASGINYPDALAGSHLSCVGNCPILLIDGSSAHVKDVQDYIKANLAEGGTIYLLGGEAVVPEDILTGLDGYEAVRLGGSDRFMTDLKILEEGLKLDPEAKEILVSTAFGFADSLSAASVGKPILLVGTALTAEQKEFLGKLEGDLTFTAIGGEGVVTKEVMEELASYGKTDRAGGTDRFETSIAVAKKFFEDPDFGVLAYAMNYPDGLCGGGLAYVMKAPLILVSDKGTDKAVAYAGENEIIHGAVLGGVTLISDDSVRAIFHMGSEDEITVR